MLASVARIIRRTSSGRSSMRCTRVAIPELSRRSTGRTVYILDEPTTGLHFEDTRKLLDVLNKLVDQGNTVVVIEHNLDVIRCADHVIDLGPEGGAAGGQVIASGSPEAIASVSKSATGQFLTPLLKGHSA